MSGSLNVDASRQPPHQALMSLLSEQLEQVSVIFERQLASDMAAVNSLCVHIEQYRGKMLRPTLVLVSGLATQPSDDAERALTDRHRTIAAVVEMIHMATLVHDDVLDESRVRRRGCTVNHLWGNETAVILGDYLISNAFHLCSTVGDPAINLALGQVTNSLCEGELVQLHHRNDLELDEATYLEIVRRKTASLIGECCRLGAWLSGADERVYSAMQRFGTSLGVAFQIQDDLLDLVGDQNLLGKPLGQDLAKGKLTLPVIHYLSQAPAQQRGEALLEIQHANLRAVQHRLMQSGAVQHTTQVAAQLVREAKRELACLRQSAAKELLEHLAEQIIARVS